MEDPSKVSEANARKYSRPHFALFLTFLKLLRRAQEQMNTITRRHLDFYFREALQLTKRAGRPDQVNVLVDLAPTIDQFELPAGALLSAGADSQGADLFYETNERILVNKAQAVKFSSVFADKRVIGIREAREDRDIPEDEAFVKMWEIALGRPLPGDPLPLYEGEHQIDHDFLLSLNTLVSFVADTLFMGFPDFRTLIRLKQRRDTSQPEWDEINTLLETAGKNREPGLDWTLENIRDFDANLNLAMGSAPDYDGITEVEDIYDLYDQRIRESVQQFIRDELYFDEIEDFNRMMQIKVRIDNEWAEIFRILREAGARRGNLSATSTFPAREPKELGAFEANLDTAVGPDVFGSLEGIADLDAYYAALLVLERHFYTSAENFAFIMSVETSERAKPEEWDLVYSLVADAHSEKIYADRRLGLQKIHEEEGADEMLQYALGDMYTQSSDVSALDQLREYISRSADYDFLVDVFSRGVEDPITGAEWERVYRVVEGGQRVRENMTEPVAQQ
ncbi:MAG: hypothetical protein GY792_23210, partial [Gammaproteobacteria bacterium]|nr:hypothetical protein [Gammaproteobacteria bacterium]